MDCCLIIDVGSVCHRAYHAMGELSFNDEPTGTLFGFFRDIQLLHDKFQPNVTSFCFDSSNSLRRDTYPNYKTSRCALMDEDELDRRIELYRQINSLPKLLRSMGFSNIYQQNGYEADDLIAVVCKNRPELTNIIISGDRDMYQLITNNTIVYSLQAKSSMTIKKLRQEFGIEPYQWWRVLAIKGCDTDDVKGVDGVGIKRAIEYITGKMNKGTQTHKNIEAASSMIRDNRALVRLPFLGTHCPPLRSDNVTDALWDAVVDKLGMTSLLRERKRV